MAEQPTQTALDVNANGHRPDELDNDTVMRTVLQGMGNSDFVDHALNSLSRSMYNAQILYREPFKQRAAAVRLVDPALYHGKLLQGISITLRERAGAWDRQVENLALAMAELDIVPLADIPREEIDWLWYPFIPRRKITLIEGDPASGKTYLIMAIAAGITRGYTLPDQEGYVGKPDTAQVGNVLYITAEDGLGDTIRPRAEKVNADLARLFVPRSPQSFSLSQPESLRNAIIRFHPDLVVLDPLQAFLGPGIDMYRPNEVRPIMTTLLALAIEFNCAVMAVRHWTKATGGRAKHRGQGNADFTAAARSQLAVGESPHDAGARIVAQSKANLAALGNSIVFRITDEGLAWCGTSTLTADELSIAQPQLQKEQRKDTMQWLKEFLKDGEKQADIVKAAARSVAISDKLLRQARERLHVLSTKRGHIWYWRLPQIQQWERERYAGAEDYDEDSIPYDN